MEALDRIRKAHIKIMQHKKACVYAGVLACGKVEVTTDIPTAATNGWDVKYNPEFVKKFLSTDEELRFVVLHEATHKAYRHLHTWQDLHEEDPHLANVAADYFVNGALMDMDDGEGFIKMPSVGIKPEPRYRGWSVKQIFEDLKQQQEEGGQGGPMPSLGTSSRRRKPRRGGKRSHEPSDKARSCGVSWQARVRVVWTACSVSCLHPGLTGARRCVSSCRRCARGGTSRHGASLIVGTWPRTSTCPPCRASL